MRLPVSHGLLHSDSLSILLASTFTEATATALCYNDDLLLESPNSKLKTFYSGTSKNGLPLLRKPPQCRQESVVPNCIALHYSCYKETSVLRTPPK